jgi:hypothetical protein
MGFSQLPTYQQESPLMSESTDNPSSSAAETSSPAPEQKPTSRRKLFRRLAWFGVIVLVGFLALSIWSVLRSGPPAVAHVKISRRPPSIMFPHVSTEDDGKDFATLGKEQVAMVTIRPVLFAALRNSTVSSLPMIANLKDPIPWLQKHLQVSFDKDAGILRIALRSGPPKARVAIVTAVRDAYLNEVVYKENDHKVRRLSKLRVFLSRSEEDLRAKRKVLHELAKSTGGVNEKLEARQKLQAGFIQSLQRELLENRSALRKAEVKLTLAERKKQPAEIARYQEEIEYLKEMGKKLSADFDEAARTVRGFNEKSIELDFLQKEIDSLETLTKEFATQKQRLEIEMDAPSRIQPLDDAALEDSRNWQDVLSDMLESLTW